jgi:hypothetical protein
LFYLVGIRNGGHFRNMVQVKLSLCLTKHHATKMNWGGGIAPRIINVGTSFSLVSGCEWTASRLGRSTPGTQWIGGWVGLVTGLDTVGNRRKMTSLLLPGIETQSSSP